MAYDIENIFTYHPPKDQAQVKKFESLRLLSKALAECILDLCPDSRERSLSLTRLEESNMWSNAAIARHE